VFSTDGRTDSEADRHEKITVAFRNFANAYKKKTAGSLLYLKQAATGLYLVSDKSSPHMPILFVKNTCKTHTFPKRKQLGLMF
jgi:hypothetical protein